MIVVHLTEDEARALVPQTTPQTVDAWNRRMELADAAHAKIRAELRKLPEPAPKGEQGTLA